MPSRPPILRPRQSPPRQLQVREPSRPSAAARGYDRDWRRLRAQHLAREPHCRFCAATGRATPAEHVDHVIPVALRPDLRLEPTNLRSLCARHHNSLTAGRSQFRQAMRQGRI